MLHLTLIIVHAVAGGFGFFLGLYLAVRPDTAWRHRWALLAYVAFIGILVLGLIAAVVTDWPSLELGQRIPFALLVVLGLYTLLRAVQGERVSQARAPGWHLTFIDHIGFTLISLFDGFVIVLAIDLGTPPWSVGIVGVAGITAGIAGVRYLQRRSGRTQRVEATQSPRG